MNQQDVRRLPGHFPRELGGQVFYITATARGKAARLRRFPILSRDGPARTAVHSDAILQMGLSGPRALFAAGRPAVAMVVGDGRIGPLACACGSAVDACSPRSAWNAGLPFMVSGLSVFSQEHHGHFQVLALVQLRADDRQSLTDAAQLLHDAMVQGRRCAASHT